MSRLDQLRRRIGQLDRALLALVAERMELAREIGEEKTRLGLPLRDYAVERVVLRRAEELALEHGLEPKLAERLLLALIEEACSVQERFSRHGATSLGRRVLIVGGWGRMGRWLAAFLRNQGHSVWILDPVAPANAMGRVATLAEGLNGAEFVLLAVPIDAVAEQMRGVAASGCSGVVADLASVKSPFLDAIREARSAGCRVTSFHPMFGPDAQTLAGKVVLFCDCGDSEATAALEAFFVDTAAGRVRLPIEEHDLVAAYVLGLSHLLNLIFARVLSRSGFSWQDLCRVGSATFQKQEAVARAVSRENPELYWAIQRWNPFTKEMLGKLEETFASWSHWIESGRAAAFQEAMAEARRYFEEGERGRRKDSGSQQVRLKSAAK